MVDGVDGDTGWSPVFALENSPSGVVLRVTDWTGGTGAAPYSPVYVGASGYVADLVNAIRIGREKLSANRTYYVRPDGSNSNTGLADTAGGAFLTPQKAIDTALAFDLSGFNIDIQLGDGTYTSGVLLSQTQVGTGTITLKGNASSPSSTVISVTNAQAIDVRASAQLVVQNLEVRVAGGGYGLYATRAGILRFSNVVFGPCASGHIRAEDGGIMQAEGPYTIAGGGSYHADIVAAIFRCQSKTVTIVNTPVFGVFARAACGGQAILGGNNYVGLASGKRFLAEAGGAVNVNGSGSDYLPGTIPGTATTGWYV